MEDPADIRDGLIELYRKVLECMEEKFPTDPKEEPAGLESKATAMLLDMENTVLKARDGTGPEHPNYERFNPALAAIYFHLGAASIGYGDLSAGEEYLMKAYNITPDHLDPKYVLSSVSVRNYLGILWCERSELEKARTWLESAEKLYQDFDGKCDPQSASTFMEIFGDETRSKTAENLDDAHTLTKFYLSQVYGSLDDHMKSAIYCHETLRRRLIYDKYDPIDWSFNCATLSQFFLDRILFTQARHHLAAASYVLNKFENSLEGSDTSEEMENKKEQFRRRSADISRYWAKYGIYLLEFSKNNLNVPESERESRGEDQCLENLWFKTLDLSEYENEIMDSELVLYEDARQAFLVAQKHLNKAKEYYSLEYHASDYAQIVQYHSLLFRHLTAFESDEDKQCKITKRRINILQDVLKELNPQYYLDICRHIWFELGECYQTIMDVKLDKVRGSKDMPTPHALTKINFLAEHSIDNFNRFLDSVKDNSTKEFPKEFDEDLIKPTLIAHFYLGRLYYKLITPDKVRQMENTNKSYSCFKFLTDYCEKSEYARDVLREELNVSKEMMNLLQLKMLQI